MNRVTGFVDSQLTLADGEPGLRDRRVLIETPALGGQISIHVPIVTPVAPEVSRTGKLYGSCLPEKSVSRSFLPTSFALTKDQTISSRVVRAGCLRPIIVETHGLVVEPSE